MGFFGGGNSASKTENNNTGQGQSNENNSGVLATGRDITTNYTVTDQGAIAAGLQLGQSGVKAAIDGISALADVSKSSTESALDFGATALDYGSYSTEQAFSAVGSVVNVLSKYAGDALAASQVATTGAMESMKTVSESDSKEIAALGIKIIGGVVVVGVLFVLAGKVKK